MLGPVIHFVWLVVSMNQIEERPNLGIAQPLGKHREPQILLLSDLKRAHYWPNDMNDDWTPIFWYQNNRTQDFRFVPEFGACLLYDIDSIVTSIINFKFRSHTHPTDRILQNWHCFAYKFEFEMLEAILEIHSLFFNIFPLRKSKLTRILHDMILKLNITYSVCMILI